MRTTSRPASIMRSRTLASLEAGPSVATILVRRACRIEFRIGIGERNRQPNPRFAPNPASPAARALRSRAASCLRETRGTRRRRSRCTNSIGDAVLRDRRERVAAAGDRKRRRGGDGFAQRLWCRRRTGRTRTRRPGRSIRSCPALREQLREPRRSSPVRYRGSGRRRPTSLLRFTSARARAATAPCRRPRRRAPALRAAPLPLVPH